MEVTLKSFDSIVKTIVSENDEIEKHVKEVIERGG